MTTLIAEPLPVRELAISGYNRNTRTIFVDADQTAARPLSKYGHVTSNVNSPDKWIFRVDARYDFDEVLAWVERLVEVEGAQ